MTHDIIRTMVFLHGNERKKINVSENRNDDDL